MNKTTMAMLLALAAPVAAQQATPFIIGGEEASMQWPWAALIDISGPAGGLCSGMQLSPNWVLTAAHCMFAEDSQLRANASEIGVVLGSAPLSFALLRPIEDYWIPSAYQAFGDYHDGNDIALIKLAERANNGDFPSIVDSASQAELESRNASGRDEALTAIGWGVTQSGGDTIPGTLQQVALDYVPFSTCNQAWNNQLDGPTMLCAAELNPVQGQRQDTCSGDSGGPLFIGEDKYPYVVGLTSFGEPQCAGSRPTVYTRLISQVGFIEQASLSGGDPLVDASLIDVEPRLYAPTGVAIDVPVAVKNASVTNTVIKPRVGGASSNDRIRYDFQWGDCDGSLSSGCQPVDSLAAGAQTDIGIVHVTAQGEFHASPTLVLSTEQPDYRPLNNRRPVTLVFSDRPDLSVTGQLTDIGYRGDAGEATLTVTVSNPSTVADADAVFLDLALPVNTTLSSSSLPCDTSCSLGTLVSGASRTLTFTLSNSAPQTGQVRVQVSDTNGGDFPDDNNLYVATLSYPPRPPASSGGGGGGIAPWLLVVLAAGLWRRSTQPG
ncbi:trypsin-like serine protease [Alloalcanivorax mobilis]|uniref:trypsin-like serine protease n=1 Tax=Alloalcanivorax mobilis TaxID=2019569 RepID=UPI000C76F7E1|nr:trypsin-like serine protease [Alloalcanivorax mobilis]